MTFDELSSSEYEDRVVGVLRDAKRRFLLGESEEDVAEFVMNELVRVTVKLVVTRAVELAAKELGYEILDQPRD